MDYAAGNVPEEYADNKAEKEALAKSAFITETWRYEHFCFIDKFVDAGGDAYMYLWKVPSTMDSMYKSSVHAIELAYVFNNLDDGIYAGEVDEETAAKAQEAWINFAKSGNPSIEGAEWSSYDTSDRNTMVIKKDGWKLESDPSKTARELMERIYGDTPYQVW